MELIWGPLGHEPSRQSSRSPSRFEVIQAGLIFDSLACFVQVQQSRENKYLLQALFFGILMTWQKELVDFDSSESVSRKCKQAEKLLWGQKAITRKLCETKNRTPAAENRGFRWIRTEVLFVIVHKQTVSLFSSGRKFLLVNDIFYWLFFQRN